MTYDDGIAIRAGVPAGIRNDTLLADIEMLLEHGHVDLPVLIEWSQRIESVTTELNALAKLVESHMPQKTAGHCHGLDIGRNRLLSMMFDIHYTQSQFAGGITTIRNRVLKILAGKQQFNLEFEP